ncbi:N-lysine methyltransferase KMT5A [Pantherophis guttatus]|uniref:[histone H4]-lysine(20) N-methyltransferase n=1 Tax=Pantherophis guttatus TaxID=94885 RepID=A0ABM3ZIC5_PANGU|nr:N-lysine methyltransferase KMT5A [Pantherophis guttatus]
MAKGRRKMPQPKPGRAEAADQGPGGDKREPARLRMNGENIFTCQAKIYSYVNPSKIPTSRPPLQEENSTTPPETKGQICKLETCQKLEGKNKSSLLGTEYRWVTRPPALQNPTARPAKPPNVNLQRLLPARIPNRRKLRNSRQPNQAWSPAKNRPRTREAKNLHPEGSESNVSREAKGKHPPNRKVTDYYPVRRSSRKNKKELQTEEKKRIDELIKSGKEDGMKIDFIDGKGRGVIATRHFNRGEFVVEYHGDLIEITDAKKREAAYAQDPSTGCYMYYFQYLSKTFCVDATKETNRLGRLVNHSKCGNCQTKLHDISGVPHLILVASRDIKAGEELLYDYGDRSKASLEAHPWLKH